MSSSSRKILFFTSGMAPEYGGAAVSEASLVCRLSKDLKVEVACRRDRWNRTFVRGFGILDVHEFEPREWVSAARSHSHPFRAWFKDVSLVHLNGHWRWEYSFISQLCLQLRIPYVIHPRGMMVVAGRKPILKRVFNSVLGNRLVHRAARLIALSRFEAMQLQAYGLNPEQIKVIPNGILGLNEKIETSQTSHSDHFLYLGRLEQRKNLLFLIDAFKEYVALGGKNKLRLKGPAEHGYEKALHDRIRQHKLDHFVSVLAPSYGDDKWKFLGQAQAVIYPCVDEPFGRVPFEAVLAGSVPVLPIESGGAEYLGGFFPSLLFDHRNTQSLVRCLWEMEKMDPEMRKSSLEAAQAWVKQTLHWDRIGDEVLSLYDKIIQPDFQDFLAAETTIQTTEQPSH